MAYREPRLRIFQDFQDALTAGAEALHAVILGPQFALHRYSEDSEKARIGSYDRLSNQTYTWPDHVAGGVIDLETAKIMLEGGLLKYFTSATPANLIDDNSNQIRLDEVVATNSSANRDASLGTRDVKVGDHVKLDWNDGSPQQALSVVNALVADITPGSTDPEISRIVGVGDQTVGATEIVASPTQFTTTYDAAAYDGLADGYPIDTYSIRVTAVSIGTGLGNLNDTVLKITSDGGDPEVSVTLSDLNWSVGDSRYEIPLGARGAILHLVDAGAGSVNVEDLWRVTVSQSYTEADVTSAADVEVTGPYTGAKNTQYILTVTTGGTCGTDNIIVDYRTTNGADSSGTITVAAADFTLTQSDYAFGNNNMILSMFDTKQWNAGDVIVFDAAVSTEGPIQTLVLRDSIPALASDDITVTLYAEETVELDSNNYTLNQNNITVFANATQQSDLLGTLQSLEVYSGQLFTDYREQLLAAANVVGSIDTLTSVPSILGPVSPLNPLAQGVYDSLSESSGVAVYYIAVGTDDLAGYTKALDVLTEEDAVYSIVPLTNAEDVKALCVSHVDERSNELNNQWRTAWIGNSTTPSKDVYSEASGGGDLVATIVDFPPNGAKRVESAGSLFVTNGVKPGDKLRINFNEVDPSNVTYDEYVIDTVSEDELILLNPLPAPIAVAVKIEVWRDLTNAEFASAIGGYSNTFDNRRVRCIWADSPVYVDGSPRELYYLCAAAAGLRSGVAPHAPLSEVTISSILLDPVYKFGRTDLNSMGSGGTWVIVKDNDGRVYTRHQLTTRSNPDDIAEREDSITTNLDHISREFYSGTRDLIGQGNISPDMIALINARIKGISLTIESRPYEAKIGPQLLGLEIVEIVQDEVLRDTVRVRLIPTLPVPLNQMDIYLTVAI
jgi:uridine phosphorylase